MECPKCNFEQSAQNLECIQCGLIFEKFRRLNSAAAISKPRTGVREQTDADTRGIIKNLFFYTKPETNPLILGARGLLFSIIFVWGRNLLEVESRPSCWRIGFVAPGSTSHVMAFLLRTGFRCGPTIRRRNGPRWSSTARRNCAMDTTLTC